MHVKAVNVLTAIKKNYSGSKLFTVPHTNYMQIFIA